MQLYKIFRERFAKLDQRFYYICCLVAALLPNIVLYWTSTRPYPHTIIGLFLPLAVYMAFFAIFKKPGKGLLWLVPLLLINAFQLVLLTIFSGGVIAVDMILNLFTSNSDEASELLSGIIIPIVGVLLFYIVMIAFALRSIRMPKELSLRSRRVLLSASLSIAVVQMAMAFRSDSRMEGYKLHHEVYPLSVFNNAYIAMGKLREVANYEVTSQGFSYDARSEREDDLPEVYVLVVGETSRACSWSLYGYDRPTNPRLMKRQEELVIFSDVITQSNTTYKSVPILLSPADAHHSEDLPKVKGLMSAMREAGFYTIYLSHQPENRSFVDFFAMQSDEHHRIRRELHEGIPVLERKPTYDVDMLPYVDRALQSGHLKLFMVLHTYGAHFNYSDRYPESEAYFANDRVERASYSQRERLINAYDNAVRQTDLLLDSLMTKLEARADVASALFYISDHGEDVYDDDRRRILHSSPSLSYYQLHIPAVLWASPLYRLLFAERIDAARANRNKAVSSNVTFHTLLDMSGVATRYRLDSLSLLSPRLHSGERYYLNDRYECQPIGSLDLTDEDRNVWQKMDLHPYWE